MMLDALGEVRLTHPMTLIEEILASGTNSVQIRNFVTPRPRENLECYFDHLDHAINAAGIDHVCIGSDRDHRVIPDIQAEIDLLVAEGGSQFLPDQWPFYITELNGPRGMEIVHDGIVRRGYSREQADKILGGNLYRLYREIIG